MHNVIYFKCAWLSSKCVTVDLNPAKELACIDHTLFYVHFCTMKCMQELSSMVTIYFLPESQYTDR